MAKQFNVSVKGLERLERIPGGLEHAQREFLGSAADKIAEKIGEAAPRKSGALQRSWKGTTISSTRAIVSSDSPYAKAQAKGAYFRGSRKKLKFDVGGRTIFMRGVRIPATNYDKKGLRTRGTIIRNEYNKYFDSLGIG